MKRKKTHKSQQREQRDSNLNETRNLAYFRAYLFSSLNSRQFPRVFFPQYCVLLCTYLMGYSTNFVLDSFAPARCHSNSHSCSIIESIRKQFGAGGEGTNDGIIGLSGNHFHQISNHPLQAKDRKKGGKCEKNMLNNQILRITLQRTLWLRL